MPADTSPRRGRWLHNRNTITNIRDVPEGWSSYEPDLHQDDVDSQITRCQERIRDGILPDIFRHRLAHYVQRRREIIAAEKSRLSWLVAQRLFFLQGKKHFLELNGDYDEQMANIMGLMAAYRAGKKFEKGRLSYWHKGAQIYPQKDGDELDYWQATHLQSRFTGAKGFWVEGLDVPWSGEVSLN